MPIVLVICMSLFVACGGSRGKNKDGYYVLDMANSSVTVGGVTRNLPDYLEWQDMTLQEYEAAGSIAIQISSNMVVIYSDGAIMAEGTFTMDGESMICSRPIAMVLSDWQIQNLKYKNGKISFTMVYGAYTHNRVYMKTGS